MWGTYAHECFYFGLCDAQPPAGFITTPPMTPAPKVDVVGPNAPRRVSGTGLNYATSRRIVLLQERPVAPPAVAKTSQQFSTLSLSCPVILLKPVAKTNPRSVVPLTTWCLLSLNIYMVLLLFLAYRVSSKSNTGHGCKTMWPY